MAKTKNTSAAARTTAATIGYEASRAKDVLGRVYEYFLSQFVSAEGKKGGGRPRDDKRWQTTTPPAGQRPRDTERRMGSLCS